MPGSPNIFTKGSILLPIIEVENELVEKENELLNQADEMVLRAKLAGEKLLDDTEKELISIEEEEREKLLASVDARVDALRADEERKLHELEKNIKNNHNAVLNKLMGKIIPFWDSQYLDRK